MTVERINSLDTAINKIYNLNTMILELNGKLEQGKFDINEIVALYDDLGSGYVRKYLRNQIIGALYTDWTHVHAEDGYSIWKATPATYTYNIVNQLLMDNIVLINKGQATAETADSFDYVFTYDGDISGGAYTDVSTEAATEVGTEFELMDSVNDYLYVGDAATFTGIKFEFQTRGSTYTNTYEYWDGAAWTTLTLATNNLVDNTSNFESDGLVTFDAPGDWATVAVNSQTKYWIRAVTSTVPATNAQAYYIIPGNSVIGKLALSSTQVQNEEWAWCSYNSLMYVTIRNSGNTDYEGSYYIASASSNANKTNFFESNHAFTSNYQNSAY